MMETKLFHFLWRKEKTIGIVRFHHFEQAKPPSIYIGYLYFTYCQGQEDALPTLVSKILTTITANFLLVICY